MGPSSQAAALERELEALHAPSHAWALACARYDPDEAAEVLQQSYVEVLAGRARFSGRSQIKTWFFGVIRNVAASRSRRAQRRRRLLAWWRREPRPVAIEPLDPTRADSVRKALGTLSPRQREVLHLVFYEDLSVSEAAEVMAVSVGSARQHYQRAKQALRALLADEDDDDAR